LIKLEITFFLDFKKPTSHTATILKIKKPASRELQNDALHIVPNKMPNINIKNCSLSKVLTAMNETQQKSLKGDITQHQVNIQVMRCRHQVYTCYISHELSA